MLDGGNRIPEMVRRAKELGMDSLAITDHGVMFGVMEFVAECGKHGIKPIVGLEAYVDPEGIQNEPNRGSGGTYHLLLLAKNLEGYRNLCKLHTVAALEGFYRKPRIDHELLRRHSAGLIGTTTCLGSEINQMLLANCYDAALDRARLYKEIFEPGSYFVELQDHGLPEQRVCNEGLVRIASELDLELIATNDVHYLRSTDDKMHDILLCVGTRARLADDDRMSFGSSQFYLKDPDEMARLFPDTPSAISNTPFVADLCTLELGKQEALMPEPELPEGVDERTHLRNLAEEGLRTRLTNPGPEAWERLEFELEVIGKTNYEAYFLLVREFCQEAQRKGIAYGVRGSAAGSLVIYALGIADVDPLEYDLTFERFLNPERVSMPDVDLDFDDERRGEIVKWVFERYGQERVAQIITFGTIGAKAALRDTGRVLEYSPAECDAVAKLITSDKMTLAEAVTTLPDLRALIDKDPRVADLVERAMSIEGFVRHASVHAAGLVISREPLVNYVPLYRSTSGEPVTAYEMTVLEKIGMLKIDLLGLTNLGAVSKTIELVRKTHASLDPEQRASHPLLEGGREAIPFDDQATFELLGRGDTVGVFQLESEGMQRYIAQLQPRSVREVCAMVALYRPGPMTHIPEFIACRNDPRRVTYLDDRMKPILEETYGVIVYQDQVLKLVQALAGFSLGKADLLRRAISKKQLDAMQALHEQFIQGCAERGIPAERSNRIWELLQPFADYAFNKAHAVCYGILAYQTAYLKAHYPVEYMTSLLDVYRSDSKRIPILIEEARRMKIEVLGPDVNRPAVAFEVETLADGSLGIRFGLGAIKGVGDGLVRKIIEERAQAPFVHLFEFADRLRPHGLNRGALEALIKAGAFDGFRYNRNTLLENADASLNYAQQRQRERDAGQTSLFGEAFAEEGGESLPSLPEAPAPSTGEALDMERSVMGVYLSDHPLRDYFESAKAISTHSCAAALELEEDVRVVVAGAIGSVAVKRAKTTGEKFATITLEDLSGSIDATVFAKTYVQVASLLVVGRPVVVTGTITRKRFSRDSDGPIEIRVHDVRELERDKIEIFDDDSIEGFLKMTLPRAVRGKLVELNRQLACRPGGFQLVIEIPGAQPYRPPVRVEGKPEVVELIKEILEHCEVELVPKGAAEVPA